MKEAKGNLWTFPADYRAITTNGAVRNDGACVMGRGCALEAKTKYPRIPYELGDAIVRGGNHVHRLSFGLVSFPVKHHWREQADLGLIERSAMELMDFLWLMSSVRKLPLTVVMPRPGCGNGSRDWESEVRPVIAPVLDDQVTVITF
jgi:hypothetical protein